MWKPQKLFTSQKRSFLGVWSTLTYTDGGCNVAADAVSAYIRPALWIRVLQCDSAESAGALLDALVTQGIPSSFVYTTSLSAGVIKEVSSIVKEHLKHKTDEWNSARYVALHGSLGALYAYLVGDPVSWTPWFEGSPTHGLLSIADASVRLAMRASTEEAASSVVILLATNFLRVGMGNAPCVDDMCTNLASTVPQVLGVPEPEPEPELELESESESESDTDMLQGAGSMPTGDTVIILFFFGFRKKKKRKRCFQTYEVVFSEIAKLCIFYLAKYGGGLWPAGVYFGQGGPINGEGFLVVFSIFITRFS